MKNSNLKTKIKSGHTVYSIGMKGSKQFSKIITVEIYLIRKVANKYWHYFIYRGEKYKVDASGLQYSYSLGEKVKILYKGKKVEATIEALLKPNSNDIPGLGYLVSLKSSPTTELLASEKWIFPRSS